MDKKPDFGQNEEIASNSVQTMMIYSLLNILKLFFKAHENGTSSDQPQPLLTQEGKKDA